jgi:copper chaperone
METLNLAIEEMSCGSCIRHVSQALQQVAGTVVDEVGIGWATVRFDPQKTTPQALVSVLADAGYPAQPTSEPTSIKNSPSRSSPPPVSQDLLDFVNSGSYPDEPTDEQEILRDTEAWSEEGEDD